MRICAAVHIRDPVIAKCGKRQRPFAQFLNVIAPPIDVQRLTGFAARRGWSSTNAGPALTWGQICNFLGASAAAQEVMSARLPCFYVPMQTLHLIGQNHWHHLIMSAGWDKRFENSTPGVALRQLVQWPTSDWLRMLRDKGWLGACPLEWKRDDSERIDFGVTQATALAKSLREWAPSILAASADGLDDDERHEERADKRRRLEGFLLKLDNLRRFPAASKQKKSFVKLASQYLPKFLAVQRLRCRASLSSTVPLCMRTAGRGQEDIADAVAGLGATDSSTISRLQLPIDAALCRYTAQKLAEDTGPIFLWADASPQGGVDWLLSTMMWVRADRLIYVFEAFSKSNIIISK